jgi:uncharacterized membrane protein (UPF0127 family)
VIALIVVAALGLPVVIGTVVLIRRAFEPEPRDVTLPVVAGFGRVGFRVGANPALRCALLAETERAREQGMQGRRDLAGYDAMVFAFAEDTTTRFINHFVPIDLSIGWYDSRGRRVDATRMEACATGRDCPTYGARDPYRYAVETPTGGLERLGLAQPGSVLHLGGACS